MAKTLTTCPTHGPKSGAFCNDCGAPLKTETIGPNLQGVWRVMTEGDVEGRSTKNLGIWKGTIAEVARKLSPQVYYALHFEAAKDPGQLVRDLAHGKVTVNVCGESFEVTW